MPANPTSESRHRRVLLRFLLLAAGVACLGGCSSSPGPRAGESSSAAPPSSGPVVPPFELEDQEGRTHRYPGSSERPTVLVLSGREAVPTNKEWDRWLLARYGAALQIYRILDLSDVPRLFRGYAIERVKEGAEPPGTPILLDWEGELLRRFSLRGDSTNILVVRPQGSVSAVVSGAPDAERTRRVAGELERLRDRGSDRDEKG